MPNVRIGLLCLGFVVATWLPARTARAQDCGDSYSVCCGYLPNGEYSGTDGLFYPLDGAVGVFDWTNIGYGSALRWQRSTRFLASHGTAVGDEVTVPLPVPFFATVRL